MWRKKVNLAFRVNDFRKMSGFVVNRGVYRSSARLYELICEGDKVGFLKAATFLVSWSSEVFL